jgi:FkbM family methyltransferase
MVLKYGHMSPLKTFVKLLLGRGVQKSYSQNGEDLLLRPFLPVKDGFYVDVGCYHPILYSNTYKYYRQGWSGIVIDPNLRLKALFSLFRSRDTFVHSGIGPVSEEREYFEFSDGAYNTFDPINAKAYEKRTRLVASYPAKIRPLSEILADCTTIDLLNIDVEGMDLEVLQSYDWKIFPRVIIVEAPFESPVHEFLKAKGYKLVAMSDLNLVLQYPKEGSVPN